MPGKIVDERDVQFALWEQLGVEKHLDNPYFKGMSKDEYNMIISEATKFAESAIYPANFEGDHQGVHVDPSKKPSDIRIKAPEAYKPVYDQMCEAGWTGLAAPEEFGGQGIAQIIGIVVTEATIAASVAFSMYPGLTHAACELILECCTDEQKQRYLPNMVSGKWQGTMCLTEPSAGSAVGDLKSIAKKRPDGKYNIIGNKIFISSGEHDMCENFVHLVLARAEGSPAGIKGVSLFIVPKYRVNDDGSLGEFNGVVCPKVEEKMGIHGSATSELLFGEGADSVGELVGGLGEGIKHMFVMMNEARIGTGLQGLCTASAAYLHALQYAKERVQGVAIENMKDVNAPRVEIIKHPDVRRMLLSMKSMVEGMRALIYRGVWYGTLARMTEDKAEKAKYEDWLALITPIIKAYCTDQGFIVTRDAIQTLGGYGFCTEYHVEQYMRDCKIGSIYEGTNAIQALDLIGRKVLDIKKQMKPYNDFIAQMKKLAEDNKGGKYGVYMGRLATAIDTFDGITKGLVGKAMGGDMAAPVRVATPYLEAMGHCVVGWLLAEQLLIADEKLEALYKEKSCGDDAAKNKLVCDNNEAAFYAGKIAGAKFFIDTVLPKIDSIAAMAKADNKDFISVPENCF